MTSENKITIAINANQTKKNGPAHIDGMIALKKIENYSYAMTDEIGLGYSSHVYKGKNDLTNEFVAVKVIDLKKEDQLNKQFINDEISILQIIKKTNGIQNLLKLFDIFKTKNNLYIITQFCEGKDMAKILRKKKKFRQKCHNLSEMEAQSIMKQLLNGYSELYNLGIVHRDLKLANIFIKKGVVKLADFGFAINEQKCQQKFEYNVGSPYYMPPQSLKYNRYSFKSDVWSMGVIAYELLYGKLPWKEKHQTLLFQKITTIPVTDLFDPETPITPEYKEFIISCLQIDFQKRATPQFIIEYPWILANSYVQGFIDIDKFHYKPQSLMKIPSQNQVIPISQPTHTMQNLSEEESIKIKFKSQFNHQVEPRSKSPMKTVPPFFKEFIHQNKEPLLNQLNQNQEKSIGVLKNKLNSNDLYENSEETNRKIESIILSQIHYCRFLQNLYDSVSENFILPEGFLLKLQIVLKIVQKSNSLKRLVENDNSEMKIEGFYQFTRRQRWQQLRQTILKYEMKYNEKFNNEANRNASNDQVLVNSIKFLSLNLQQHYFLAEDLTYYYQLKQLEKRSNHSNFGALSKIDILAKKRCSIKVPSDCYERFTNKLILLNL